MQSGAQFYGKNSNISTDKALNESRLMAHKLNCSDDNKWVDCLREREAKDFIDYDIIANYMSPTLETEFLPMRPQMAFQTKNFNKGFEIN